MKRDWRAYNEELVKRGEILISKELLGIDVEEKKGKKRGRPYVYSEGLIRLLLIIKFLLRLPYRQTEGIARVILGAMGVKVPNFRTLHYRLKKMEVERLIDESLRDIEELEDGFVIAIDSTGEKRSNRGEWKGKRKGKKKGGEDEKGEGEQGGEQKRKGWIKIHVAYDIKRKKVIAVEVTDEKVRDSQKGKELIEKAKERGKIKKVIADAGYDTYEMFRYLHDEGIEAAILVRRDAIIKGDEPRDAVVKAIQRLGRKGWKKLVGYGKRWLVESFFSVFKRWFGEYVSSVKFDLIKKEIYFKIFIYNIFLSPSTTY